MAVRRYDQLFNLAELESLCGAGAQAHAHKHFVNGHPLRPPFPLVSDRLEFASAYDYFRSKNPEDWANAVHHWCAKRCSAKAHSRQ